MAQGLILSQNEEQQYLEEFKRQNPEQADLALAAPEDTPGKRKKSKGTKGDKKDGGCHLF